jgi:DNA-binding NarL/FixJ family response regulator
LIRVLLVEDFRPYRSFVISLLSQNLEIDVCEAEDGLQAIVQAQQLKPDVILIDIGLPELNGLEAARQLRELVPRSKILFLSGLDDPGIVMEALRIGASGYVVKSDEGSELTKAIEAVLRGEQYLSITAKGAHPGGPGGFVCL